MDISRAGRGTGPISNRRIVEELKAITGKELLAAEGNRNLNDDFTAELASWVSACKSAPVRGLDQFTTRYFVNGVTQTYDIFFYEHKGRRFRTLKGEYPYVRLSVPDWAHIEDDEIRENDAVAMTCPFYGDGGVPRHYLQLLDRCAELGVPVMIDAAYYGTCYGVSFDFSHPAIEMLSFSLSKPMGIQSYRAGALFMKRTLPYLEEIQTAARYFNRIGAHVGLKLMRLFSADFLPNTYRVKHAKACRELAVMPSHCLMLANLRDEDRRFDEVLRDDRFEELVLPAGVFRRICVSDYLSDQGSPIRRLARMALGR